jgi:metal-responsive CopG/Arc/MetJ family transcriptional regulator
MKTRVTLTLDSDFVEEIDETRGDVSRSRFVERLLLETWKASGMWKKRKENAAGVEGYA